MHLRARVGLGPRPDYEVKFRAGSGFIFSGSGRAQARSTPINHAYIQSSFDDVLVRICSLEIVVRVSTSVYFLATPYNFSETCNIIYGMYAFMHNFSSLSPVFFETRFLTKKK